jgi:outer membrane protein assembly factor BamB
VLTEGLQPTDPGIVTAFDEAGTAGCSGSPVTCHPLFATSAVAPRVRPAVADGHLYADSADHSAVLAFDAAGQVGCPASVCTPQFRFTTGTSTTVSISGNLAYAGVGTEFRAFDATGTTGCGGTPKACSPVWIGPLASDALRDPPVVAAGHVFVGLGSGNIDVFDAGGSSGCGVSTATCQPLWTVATGVHTSMHLGAARSVLAVSWLDATPFGPGPGFHIGVDAFDVSGTVGCSGAPKVCAPIGQVDLASLESVSSPAIASGRIVLVTGFSGIAQVLGPAG